MGISRITFSVNTKVLFVNKLSNKLAYFKFLGNILNQKFNNYENSGISIDM